MVTGNTSVDPPIEQVTGTVCALPSSIHSRTAFGRHEKVMFIYTVQHVRRGRVSLTIVLDGGNRRSVNDPLDPLGVGQDRDAKC